MNGLTWVTIGVVLVLCFVTYAALRRTQRPDPIERAENRKRLQWIRKTRIDKKG